jgi:hypothetical protein
MRNCEGDCEEHRGDVVLVHVFDASIDWDTFWYCDAAIAKDRSRGYTVNELKSRRPSGAAPLNLAGTNNE